MSHPVQQHLRLRIRKGDWNLLSPKVAHRLTPRTPLEGSILPPAEGSELAVTADYSPLWFDELRLRAGERVTFLGQICPG